MIRFFQIDDPIDFKYAQATRLGSWYPKDRKPCVECGRSNQKRIPPLVIDWETGSDQVGDFTWPGFNEDIIIQDNVRRELEGKFIGFQFESVVMFEQHATGNQKDGEDDIKRKVRFPYKGPSLWDLWITSWCHIDPVLSKFDRGKECSTCKRVTVARPGPRQQDAIIERSAWNG